MKKSKFIKEQIVRALFSTNISPCHSRVTKNA
jgi:hypothetical protein